jgi:hypothetical protein
VSIQVATRGTRSKFKCSEQASLRRLKCKVYCCGCNATVFLCSRNVSATVVLWILTAVLWFCLLVIFFVPSVREFLKGILFSKVSVELH